MASKCSIKIGFGETIEYPENSGIFKEFITEKKYKGSVVGGLHRRLNLSDKENHDLDLSCKIQVLMNTYIASRFSSIRYVEYMGVKWTVEALDILYPDIEMTLGGIYHEQ